MIKLQPDIMLSGPPTNVTGDVRILESAKFEDAVIRQLTSNPNAG
jgi:hypothetical protein